MEERLPDIIDKILANGDVEAPEGYFDQMQAEVLSRHKKSKANVFDIRRILAVAAGLALLVFTYMHFDDRKESEYLLTDIDDEILLEYLIEEGEIEDILEIEGDDMASLDEVLNWN